jgi:DNA-binding GntR family transcriptional regulator
MSQDVSALEIVRTRSLASLVAQEIEAMILAGTLAAGERLNEQQLAVRLGVSRGPVREAVRGLERSGLVVSVRNQGSYVRSVSASEALEIYDLRAALTGLACARLAEAATAEQRGMLDDLVQRMEAAWQAEAASAYYALNLEFPRRPAGAWRRPAGTPDLRGPRQRAEPVPPPRPGRAREHAGEQCRARGDPGRHRIRRCLRGARGG